MYPDFTTEFIGLPDFHVFRYVPLDANRHLITLEPKESDPKCPDCGSSTHTHGHRQRMMRHRFCPDFGTIYIQVPAIRKQCNVCNKTFSMKWQGIPERGMSTAFYQQMVVNLCKNRDLLSVARELALPYTTLERWYYKLAPSMLPIAAHVPAPNIVCLDEFALQKGHRYAVNVMDHQSGHVWAIGQGRSRLHVQQTLQSWPFEQTPAVVVTDLAPGMAETVKQVWPSATLVADKFHVIQLFTKALEVARKQSNSCSKHAKGRHQQRLIHSPVHRLKPHEQQELQRWLAQDSRLRELHQSLQDMREVYQAETYEEGTKRLHQWLQVALIHNNPVIQRIGKTIAIWRKSIEAYFKHRVTNAPIEGTHNKIKVIKRRAYGYRNLQHFLIRIRLECKSA